MKNILRFILLILLVLSTGCSNSSSKKQILDCDYYNYGMDYNVQFLYENNILHSIVIYNSFDYSDSNMSIDEVLHPDNIEKQENSLLEMFGSEFDTNNNGKVLIHSSLIDWSNLDYRFTENVGIGKEVIEESLSISSLKSKIEEISSSTIGKKLVKYYSKGESNEKSLLVLAISMMFISCLGVTTNIEADDSSIDYELISPNIAIDYDVSSVNLLGHNTELLITYSDQAEALGKFTDNYDDIFSLIENLYKIDNIKKIERESLVLYVNDFIQGFYDETIDPHSGYPSKDTYHNFSRDNILTFEIDYKLFMDIYENVEVNNRIMELSNAINSSADAKNIEGLRLFSEEVSELGSRSDLDELLEEVLSLIPVDSKIITTISKAQNDNKSMSIQPYLSGSGLTSAINYATRYAGSSNSLDYADLTNRGGDCTNFVSQVVHAGGKQMGSLSWYHRRVIPGTGTSHINFNFDGKWVLANSFLSHWGYSGRYTGINTASNYFRAGDVILVDYNGDKSPDHAGFVTTRNAYPNSNGLYDARIAQHTPNSHSWASGNNWGGYKNGTIWIIRP